MPLGRTPDSRPRMADGSAPGALCDEEILLGELAESIKGWGRYLLRPPSRTRTRGALRAAGDSPYRMRPRASSKVDRSVNRTREPRKSGVKVRARSTADRSRPAHINPNSSLSNDEGLDGAPLPYTHRESSTGKKSVSAIPASASASLLNPAASAHADRSQDGAPFATSLRKMPQLHYRLLRCRMKEVAARVNDILLQAGEDDAQGEGADDTALENHDYSLLTAGSDLHAGVGGVSLEDVKLNPETLDLLRAAATSSSRRPQLQATRGPTSPSKTSPGRRRHPPAVPQVVTQPPAKRATPKPRQKPRRLHHDEHATYTPRGHAQNGAAPQRATPQTVVSPRDKARRDRSSGGAPRAHHVDAATVMVPQAYTAGQHHPHTHTHLRAPKQHLPVPPPSPQPSTGPEEGQVLAGVRDRGDPQRLEDAHEGRTAQDLPVPPPEPREHDDDDELEVDMGNIGGVRTVPAGAGAERVVASYATDGVAGGRTTPVHARMFTDAQPGTARRNANGRDDAPLGVMAELGATAVGSVEPATIPGRVGAVLTAGAAAVPTAPVWAAPWAAKHSVGSSTQQHSVPPASPPRVQVQLVAARKDTPDAVATSAAVPVAEACPKCSPAALPAARPQMDGEDAEVAKPKASKKSLDAVRIAKYIRKMEASWRSKIVQAETQDRSAVRASRDSGTIMLLERLAAEAAAAAAAAAVPKQAGGGSKPGTPQKDRAKVTTPPAAFIVPPAGGAGSCVTCGQASPALVSPSRQGASRPQGGGHAYLSSPVKDGVPREKEAARVPQPIVRVLEYEAAAGVHTPTSPPRALEAAGGEKAVPATRYGSTTHPSSGKRPKDRITGTPEKASPSQRRADMHGQRVGSDRRHGPHGAVAMPPHVFHASPPLSGAPVWSQAVAQYQPPYGQGEVGPSPRVESGYPHPGPGSTLLTRVPTVGATPSRQRGDIVLMQKTDRDSKQRVRRLVDEEESSRDKLEYQALLAAFRVEHDLLRTLRDTRSAAERLWQPTPVPFAAYPPATPHTAGYPTPGVAAPVYEPQPHVQPPPRTQPLSTPTTSASPAVDDTPALVARLDVDEEKRRVRVERDEAEARWALAARAGGARQALNERHTNDTLASRTQDLARGEREARETQATAARMALCCEEETLRVAVERAEGDASVALHCSCVRHGEAVLRREYLRDQQQREAEVAKALSDTAVSHTRLVLSEVTTEEASLRAVIMSEENASVIDAQRVWVEAAHRAAPAVAPPSPRAVAAAQAEEQQRVLDSALAVLNAEAEAAQASMERAEGAAWLALTNERVRGWQKANKHDADAAMKALTDERNAALQKIVSLETALQSQSASGADAVRDALRQVEEKTALETRARTEAESLRVRLEEVETSLTHAAATAEEFKKLKAEKNGALERLNALEATVREAEEWRARYESDKHAEEAWALEQAAIATEEAELRVGIYTEECDAATHLHNLSLKAFSSSMHRVQAAEREQATVVHAEETGRVVIERQEERGSMDLGTALVAEAAALSVREKVAAEREELRRSEMFADAEMEQRMRAQAAAHDIERVVVGEERARIAIEREEERSTLARSQQQTTELLEQQTRAMGAAQARTTRLAEVEGDELAARAALAGEAERVLAQALIQFERDGVGFEREGMRREQQARASRLQEIAGQAERDREEALAQAAEAEQQLRLAHTIAQDALVAQEAAARDDIAAQHAEAVEALARERAVGVSLLRDVARRTAALVDTECFHRAEVEDSAASARSGLESMFALVLTATPAAEPLAPAAPLQEVPVSVALAEPVPAVADEEVEVAVVEPEPEPESPPAPAATARSSAYSRRFTEARAAPEPDEVRKALQTQADSSTSDDNVGADAYADTDTDEAAPAAPAATLPPQADEAVAVAEAVQASPPPQPPAAESANAEGTPASPYTESTSDSWASSDSHKTPGDTVGDDAAGTGTPMSKDSWDLEGVGTAAAAPTAAASTPGQQSASSHSQYSEPTTGSFSSVGNVGLAPAAEVLPPAVPEAPPSMPAAADDGDDHTDDDVVAQDEPPALTPVKATPPAADAAVDAGADAVEVVTPPEVAGVGDARSPSEDYSSPSYSASEDANVDVDADGDEDSERDAVAPVAVAVPEEPAVFEAAVEEVAAPEAPAAAAATDSSSEGSATPPAPASSAAGKFSRRFAEARSAPDPAAVRAQQQLDAQPEVHEDKPSPSPSPDAASDSDYSSPASSSDDVDALCDEPPALKPPTPTHPGVSSKPQTALDEVVVTAAVDEETQADAASDSLLDYLLAEALSDVLSVARGQHGGSVNAAQIVAALQEEGLVDDGAALREREEREAAARAEQERLEAERLEAERLAKEEAERVEAERMEAERLEAERMEAERREAEREEAERLAEAEEAARAAEAARLVEEERLAREEEERQEAERLEAERVEREREKREAAERAEQERLEAERLAKEEAERVEAERLEAERRQKEREEREEAERIEAERLQKEREEAERLECERVEREREEAERVEQERREREAERLERERAEAEAEAEKEILDRERAAVEAEAAMSPHTVGDRVRVRDSEADAWQMGVVASKDAGLLVTVDGSSASKAWAFVEAAAGDDDASPDDAADAICDVLLDDLLEECVDDILRIASAGPSADTPPSPSVEKAGDGKKAKKKADKKGSAGSKASEEKGGKKKKNKDKDKDDVSKTEDKKKKKKKDEKGDADVKKKKKDKDPDEKAKKNKDKDSKKKKKEDKADKDKEKDSDKKKKKNKDKGDKSMYAFGSGIFDSVVPALDASQAATRVVFEVMYEVIAEHGATWAAAPKDSAGDVIAQTNERMEQRATKGKKKARALTAEQKSFHGLVYDVAAEARESYVYSNGVPGTPPEVEACQAFVKRRFEEWMRMSQDTPEAAIAHEEYPMWRQGWLANPFEDEVLDEIVDDLMEDLCEDTAIWLDEMI